MRDKTKQEHFLTFMSNILDKGFAEEVPPLPDTEECWYLPIVYHPKKPSQIHVVFDSSAQCQRKPSQVHQCKSRLWERLGNRYGRPQMIEAALKIKLSAFPKLSSLFAYFD